MDASALPIEMDNMRLLLQKIVQPLIMELCYAMPAAGQCFVKGLIALYADAENWG